MVLGHVSWSFQLILVVKDDKVEKVKIEPIKREGKPEEKPKWVFSDDPDHGCFITYLNALEQFFKERVAEENRQAEFKKVFLDNAQRKTLAE